VGKAKELDETGPHVCTEINVFELMYGIHRSKRVDRQKRVAQAKRLFSRLITLPLNHESALKAGELLGELARRGKEVSTLDGLTASITLVHGCREIVTKNVEHFEAIPGIRVETY